MIEFTDVTKSYTVGTHALRGVSMQIEDGEFAFLVGSFFSVIKKFLERRMPLQ